MTVERSLNETMFICLMSKCNEFILTISINFSASTAQKSGPPVRTTKNSSSSSSGERTDQEDSDTSSPPSARKSSRTIVAMRRPSIMAASLKTQHYGSFYLRMGAVGKYKHTSSFPFRIKPQNLSALS